MNKFASASDLTWLGVKYRQFSHREFTGRDPTKQFATGSRILRPEHLFRL